MCRRRVPHRIPVGYARVDQFMFEEHVVYRGQALLQSIKLDLLKILREVFGDLSAAGGDLSLFGKSLSRYSTRIERAEDNETLQKSLKELLLEVKNVEASSAALERRLESANEEVKLLQIKLKEAEQHATTDALNRALEPPFL